MKKIIKILVMALVTLPAYSQTRFPLPETNAFWHYIHTAALDDTDYIMTEFIDLTGTDTIIGTHTYERLMRKYWDAPLFC